MENAHAKVKGDTKKQWSTLFAQNTEHSSQYTLRYVPPAVSNRIKVAKFQRAEIQAKTLKWICAIVGSVYGIIPRFHRVEAYALNRGRYIGFQYIQKIDEYVFLFNFSDVQSQQGVLLRGPYTFNEHLFILKPWQPLMKFDLCNVKKIPVWVRLPLLPWELWPLDILSRIGSLLGTPLFTDHCIVSREKLEYTRLLIEMEV